MRFCPECGEMMKLESIMFSRETYECLDCGTEVTIDKGLNSSTYCTTEQEDDDTGRGVSTREPSHPLE